MGRQIIETLAPVLKRNFVVMQVKGNLLADERKSALARFPSQYFKRICRVTMGDPSADFTAWVHQKLLAEKQVLAENEAKKKRAEQVRKKAEAERKKKVEAAKKARELAA